MIYVGQNKVKQFKACVTYSQMKKFPDCLQHTILTMYIESYRLHTVTMKIDKIIETNKWYESTKRNFQLDKLAGIISWWFATYNRFDIYWELLVTLQ